MPESVSPASAPAQAGKPVKNPVVAPKGQRARGPIGFKLALLLFPLGLIIGIVVALLKWAANEDDPQAAMGRGQALDRAHLADLATKAQAALDLPLEQRQATITAFIGGTLGSAANAGLQVEELTLQGDHAGLWQVVRRPSAGKRAGLVLWLARPDEAAATAVATASSSSAVAGKAALPAQRLAVVLNALEDLARRPAGERELVLVIHPQADFAQLTAEPARAQALETRLGLRHGGEYLELDPLLDSWLAEASSARNPSPGSAPGAASQAGVSPATAAGTPATGGADEAEGEALFRAAEVLRKELLGRGV